MPRAWRSEGLAWTVGGCLAVGLALGGLLVGYEPVGGDPDRMYRPIKEELAASLREGRLPFWSDRLGVGFPMLAESHSAALYPPNWLLYRALRVPPAYRLSMWLHFVALAAATAAYARVTGVGPPGSALAGVTFALCGFLTIHSSHEPFYCALPYLPLALLAADRYAETGRAAWLAGLATLWGVQITLGHFQLQTWTALLAFATGSWRVLADDRPRRRIAGLGLGLAWGALVAAPQLVPTWELATRVGQTERAIKELASYSYPPSHWAEVAVPGLFRSLTGGPEGPYWMSERTTRYEACLFVGTVPLVLAFVGFLAGGRRLTPWRVLVPLSLALATSPRWWLEGFSWLTKVPFLGDFRAPARYTAIASLGLALLAGRGLDRSIASRRFRAGLALALTFATAAFAWAWFVATTRPSLRAELTADALTGTLATAALAWVMAMAAILAWRVGRIGPWCPFLVALVELGIWFHLGSTTVWGWAVDLPGASPVLSRLAREPGVQGVGGVLDNLPLRAGLPTAAAYTGFPLPQPDGLLRTLRERGFAHDPNVVGLLRRFGVSHVVWDVDPIPAFGEEIYRGPDPVLDLLTYRPADLPARRTWRILALPKPFPMARVVRLVEIVPEPDFLLAMYLTGDHLDRVFYLPEDAPPPPTTPSARAARVIAWRGRSGEVEHDGSCDLVLNVMWYPGWVARINDGPERPVHRAENGLISVRLDGEGPVSRVALSFVPSHFATTAGVSALATLTAAVVIVGSALSEGKWSRSQRSSLADLDTRPKPVS
ncbi:MAG: hypothetical protein AB7I30_04490 [Isosphaeraceae bacterium]